MKFLGTIVIAVLVFALLASGCTPAAQPTGQGAKEKTTMAVGGVGALLYIQATLAKQLGYFDQEGLDVEVSDFKGGAESAQALIGGSSEFASMSVEHIIKAKPKGVDLTLLALYTRYPAMTLIVGDKYKDQIKGVADLKGKKVGVTSLGSGTHMALNAILAKNGLPTNAVELVGVGSTTMPPALEQGSIVAAMNADPFVTKLLLAKKAYVLVDLTTKKDTEAVYGSDYPFTGLATRAEVVKNKPQLVQKMTSAIVKTNKWIAEHSAKEIADKMPPEFKQDEQVYIASLEHTKEALSPDGKVNPKAIETVIKSLQEVNTIPADAKIDPASIYDMSFAEKALKK